MHFESRVTGIVARTVLTISFKDVQSPAGTDSMEVNFNFNLPDQSVVDSMYLWINGTPQSAALKERWSAVSAYRQLVGLRWAPALLTKWSDNAYNLRIFPFSHGEERTVRICYTTPLTVQDSLQFWSLNLSTKKLFYSVQSLFDRKFLQLELLRSHTASIGGMLVR